MTAHLHTEITAIVRGWWHDPFDDMGYSAVRRKWGTYWSNCQVYVSGLPVAQLDAFLEDLRAYFPDCRRFALIHLDTAEDKGRLGSVLVAAGCQGPARESYLIHTAGHPLPPTGSAIQLIPVSGHNLAQFADTKLRAWSGREADPDDRRLQAEIERRRRELQGSGRGMLAMIGESPAGFIWWFDEAAGVRWIRQLATRTPYRQGGVATRMLVDCLQTAYRAGVRAVVISVEPDNPPALRLYTEIGFHHAVYELDTYTRGKPLGRIGQLEPAGEPHSGTDRGGTPPMPAAMTVPIPEHGPGRGRLSTLCGAARARPAAARIARPGPGLRVER